MGLKSGSKSGKGIKQSATKLSMGKSTPQSSSKQTDSEDEPDIDTSVMRPSIEISVSTVPQLVRAYQAATEELKSILARECDIIYECRVCRNLFRSLANMMAHKRVYCKTTYSYTKHTLNRNHTVEDYTVLIQPEPVPSNSQDEQNWTTSDKVPDCSNENDNAESQIVATTSRISTYTNSKKGLHEIVDRLARNTRDSNETMYGSATKLYDNINASMLACKKDHIEHSFHLEDIETSKVGMFQTKLLSVVGSEKDDLMKAQVSELQHMASQNEAVLGPDGRMIMLNKHSPHTIQKSSLVKMPETGGETNEYKVTKNEHVCPDCNVKFSTRKTLNHHMKSLHVTFRLCYPCPCCKSTFVNPWSVYRHLYKVHRKTAAQVRRLRPQIQKKSFKKEIRNEVPAPECNPKNEALRELQRRDQENQAWMDNFEDDLELQRCGGCGRRFERRAALNSHSQICQKRIAARNNVKAMRNISSVSSADKVIKISQAEEHSIATETNKKSSNISKSIDSVNNTSNTLGSTRTHQGCNWVDQPKKEIPEKKIAIQIRKDYCKMSSASSVVALSNDTQSEPDSRPPSRIIEDEDCYGDERDWESMIGVEDVNKDESDSEYPLFRDVEGPNVLTNENNNEEEDGDAVCTDSPIEDSGSGTELNSSVRDNVLDKYDLRKDDFCMYGRPENILKRRVSDESTCLLKNVDSETIKRRRKFLENENYNGVEDSKKTLSPKNKKLDQFHPVMEARMKKLINIRRLQCLPCQKKFIKLTNLRRHVAVHIGWCRYKCMLCPFKCFSKYDCVDHVCKIHLKGTQRNKASTMVEYIEEQETEATTGTVEIEESSDCCDIISNGEEAPESLAVEINSLNLEDIKNIVGVPCYPDAMSKSEQSSTTPEINEVNSPPPSQLTPEDNISLNKEKRESDLEIVSTQTIDVQEFNKLVSKEEEDKSNKEKDTSTMCLEVLEQEQKYEEILSNQSMNDCNNMNETEQMHSTKDLREDAEEEKKDTGQELTWETSSEETSRDAGNETSRFADKDIAANEPEQLASISNDEHAEKDSVKPVDVSTNEVETARVSQYLIYDEQKSDVSELVMEEESVGLLMEPKATTAKKCESADCYFQDSEIVCDQEMIVKSGGLNSELPINTVIGLTSDISDRIDVSTCADSSKSEEDEEKEEKIPSEIMEYPDSPLNPERDENALRKMVMEVIFGSGGTSDSHSDPNQNLISVSMNGNVIEEDSSDGRYSRASTSSDSDVVLNNHVSSTSKVVKRNIESEHGHGLEGERRERPVRNRVKVEKEDFIYDFTDSFLKKEESLKVGNNTGGGSSSNRKKIGDSGKESVKYDLSHNSSLLKSVPKLMLVRTDDSETPGSKRVTGPIKGSWSSVYAPTSDCAVNKNYMESNSQMCSSSRKLPRTHDVKQ